MPLQMQIAAEQQTFQKAAAQLSKQNEPLSVATIAPKQPSSYHRSAFDVPGKLMRDDAQALLFPQAALDGERLALLLHAVRRAIFQRLFGRGRRSVAGLLSA